MQTRKQCPIFKEHKFLRNAFSIEELTKTDSMKDVKHHRNCVRFLKIVVFLQNAFNTCDEFNECFNDDFVKIIVQIVLILTSSKK